MPDKLEQGRAEFAFRFAENAFSQSYKEQYKQYSKKLPMMIKTNGLAPTFAFMFSKDESKNEGRAYHQLGSDILTWLKNAPSTQNILQGVNSFKRLIEKSIQVNSIEYNLLTVETINLLLWLRKFTEGIIR